MNRNMIGTLAAGAGIALALSACTPAAQDGPQTSAPPTFSTIPASPSIPAPAPLRADGTATLTITDMSSALTKRDIPWLAKDVITMGELTIDDYRARDEQCKRTGDYFRACASRDAQRSGLPSRCIVEAERTDTMPDFGACGLALLYVKAVGK